MVLLFLFLPRPVSLLLSGPLDEVNHMGLLVHISGRATTDFRMLI